MRQVDGYVGAAKLLFVCLLPGLAGVLGCRDQHDGDATAAALTVPVPPVTQFAVLAARTVSIGDRGNVTGGHLGVAAGATNSMTTGTDSQVGVGRVLLAPIMALRDRTVAGEIGANTINVGVNVTTGPRSAYVAPPPAPPISAFTAGNDTVTVNAGQTQTLAAGDHGNVTVNGTLNLSGGTYEIQSLRIGADGRVVANAASLVRIQTGLQISDRGDLVAGGSLGAGGLRVTINGAIDGNVNSASLGTDVLLTGIIVARNVFRTGDRFVGTGAVSAQDVILGNDSRLTFAVGFGCSNNAGCNDSNACTTDTCVDSACVHVNAPNGTTCSDGNPCTQTDTCQTGACVGGNPVICPPSDQCHVAGTCNTATGICSNPNAPNGTACNDGNACTQTSTCQAGMCTGANPVVCVASDQCHVAGTCNTATGICSNPNAPNGTACNDNNACTQTSTCQAGTCAGGNPVVCAPGDQCHVAGVCNPTTGVCSNPNAPNGSPCTDGNACTQTDTCQTGVCAGGNPVTCTAGDQCHVAGTCNPTTGACSNPNAPNGTPCSDGNACTQPDTCQAGACTAGNPVTCIASDQCHGAGACNPSTGACTNPNAPDGTACNDGNVCTTTDTCQGGTCTGGASIVTEYASGLPQPKQITPGPDGNLWFVSTEAVAGVGAVARIVPASGAVTSFLTNAAPRTVPLLVDDIVAAPDGNLWFTGRDPAAGDLPVLATLTPAGAFIVPDLRGSSGAAIAVGPDGNIWSGGNYLGYADTLWRQTVVATFLSVSTTPRALVAGPDANLWLVESNGSGAASIGRVVPSTPGNEVLTEFPVTTGGDLNDIASGPDGNLWFTDAGNNEIGRITPAGTIAKFAVPTPASGVHGIIAGPDGNLWFTESLANKIARITTAGTVTELACIPTANSGPTNVTVGADGRLWLTETNAGQIARVRLP
jgi:streptogramin lyase